MCVCVGGVCVCCVCVCVGCVIVWKQDNSSNRFVCSFALAWEELVSFWK